MPLVHGDPGPVLIPAPPGVLVLRSEHFEAWVIPFGARLIQLFWLHAPQGPRPLSLGFSDPEAYRQDTMSMGAVCGRYGNRIGGAVLERGDKRYALDANHPLGHCIHGGQSGWGQRDWRLAQHDASGVSLTLDSADGDMGFAAFSEWSNCASALCKCAGLGRRARGYAPLKLASVQIVLGT